MHQVAHWSPKTYHATAELVVADPPLADDRKGLRNAHACHHRIVLIERGGVPIVDKVCLSVCDSVNTWTSNKCMHI